MNEQVLKDLYDRAVSKGYQKSIEELKKSGALKTYQRNIDIPFIGKTKIPS